jgi:hypothetical protein
MRTVCGATFGDCLAIHLLAVRVGDHVIPGRARGIGAEAKQVARPARRGSRAATGVKRKKG